MTGRNLAITGTVSSGMKEGNFFMSLEPYLIAMEKMLGYVPFKGTLNLKVELQEAKKFLKSLQLISIDGFKKGTKKFGKVYCYPCKIKHVQCAIIVPEFTHHGLDIIEIIAEVKLRDSLNLNDGDKITIESK